MRLPFLLYAHVAKLSIHKWDNLCNSDSGGGKESVGGASGARTEAHWRGPRKQGLGVAKGRMQQGPLRAEGLRRYKRTEARWGANRVASNPHAHGGARTLSKGVKKLSSSFRILARALARASAASSNSSRVKVTRGICV